MVLKFHETYRSALPILKVGHVIKAGAGSKEGSGFWIVKKVMPGRIKLTETGVITKRMWISKTAAVYGQVSGNLNTERIVHLQYLACLDINDALLFWGNDPLFSVETDSTVNNVITPDVNPILLDKWSYDQSMFIAVSITTAVSQNFIVETVNYEVEPLKGTLPKKYLELTAEGNAVFINAIGKGPTPTAVRKRNREEEEELD